MPAKENDRCPVRLKVRGMKAAWPEEDDRTGLDVTNSLTAEVIRSLDLAGSRQM